MHGDYSEDHGMTTAIFSKITVSISFINVKGFFYAVTFICKFSVKVFGWFYVQPPCVYKQSVDL